MVSTPNTEMALAALRLHTSKRVVVRPVSEFHHPSFAGSYLGAVDESDEAINVYISELCPEQSLVHEVLHKVLDCEGFPNAWIDAGFAKGALPAGMLRALPALQAAFTSTVQHPEVFRRMEDDYDLDLDGYYALQAGQKLGRLERLSANENPVLYHFFRQEDILLCLDCLLWGGHGRKVLAYFRETFAEAHASCLELAEKVRARGFSTPGAALESALAIREHIMDYGERNLADRRLNDMWRALDVRLPEGPPCQ